MVGKRLSVVLLLAVIAVAGGCATGGNDVSNTIYSTNTTVRKMAKDVEELKKGAGGADVVSGINSNEQQVRQIQGSVDEMQMKLKHLQQSLDDLTAMYCKQEGLTSPARKSSSASSTPVERSPGEFTFKEPTRAPAGDVEPPMPPPVPPKAIRQEDSPAQDIMPAPSAAGQTPIPSPTTPTEAKSSSSSPVIDFQKAKDAFLNQDFEKALKLFGDFLRRYPSTDLSADAQFYEANCYGRLQKNDDAIKAYERFRTDHPTSQQISKALYNEAVAYLRLGQNAQAEALFNQVTEEYPATDAANSARTALKKLRGN